MNGMFSPRRRCAFTLVEVLIAVGLIVVLLSLLLPALTSARSFSHREQCAENLRKIGQAVKNCLAENGDEFPFVPVQPGWQWGGVRFSAVDGSPFLDYNRPLNQCISPGDARGRATQMFCCPADRGIAGEVGDIGTGRRTACRSFGTSYRANPALFDARLAGLPDEARGLRRAEITTSPARLLVMGDAMWYEVAENTGRTADWHGEGAKANLLFLDGSVRFREVLPRGVVGPVMFDPIPTHAMPAAGVDGSTGGVRLRNDPAP